MAVLILGFLMATSLLSYLIFHSLVETIISTVAFSVFVIAWTARHYMDNNYLMVLAVVNLFVGLLGLVHLLAYRGMGIFPGDSANLPTQLWIASRYMIAITLVLAPLSMRWKLDMKLVIASYAVVTMLALVAISLGFFPAAYIDGLGLTPFKVWSEYLVSALMILAIFLLYRERGAFHPDIFNLLVASIGFTVAGELMFTLYNDPYGVLNLLGHLSILTSALLTFMAIVRTGVVQPYDLIFRSLKRSESSLRSERDFAEAIITNAQAIVLVVGNDGRILRVNPYIEEVTGWKQEELVTREWAEVLLPEGETKAGRRMISELLARSNRTSFSGKIVSRGGEVREVEWRIKPLDGLNSRPDGMLFIGHDVTDERKLERALSERAQELSRSNGELNQFAYVASHDLQEPLRMVTAYLELLERKYGDSLDGDARQYMRYAVDGAVRMRELIRDLLAYSRVESGGGEFTDVDMNEALSTALSNLRSSMTVNSATVKAEHLSTITADRTQMTQLFQNLVGNAIKYHGKEPPMILVSCADGPGSWTFSVRDNGIGIASEQYDRIFQMFSRLHTKEEYPGTGIGLAISKRIVERHGGRIWVESTPGIGSEFFFTIPKSATPSLESGTKEQDRREACAEEKDRCPDREVVDPGAEPCDVRDGWSR